MENSEIIEDKTLEYGMGDFAVKVLLLKEQIGLGLIGMISSKSFKQNVALVKNEDSTVGGDFGPAYHGSSLNGAAQRVGMDARLIDGLREESAEALTILFHELGHMVNQDSIAVGRDEEEYQQGRKDCVKAGRVEEREILADNFAAKYLGAQMVIEGLSSLLEHEKTAYSPDEYDQDEIDIMLSELRLRIEYQRKTITDE